jgi:hypothetical protein
VRECVNPRCLWPDHRHPERAAVFSGVRDGVIGVIEGARGDVEVIEVQEAAVRVTASAVVRR